MIAENVTGSVNQELLLQNEYLTAENRILKAPTRQAALDGERATLGGNRQAFKTPRTPVARIAKPNTIAWYRKLVVDKFDGSNSAARRSPDAGGIGLSGEGIKKPRCQTPTCQKKTNDSHANRSA